MANDSPNKRRNPQEIQALVADFDSSGMTVAQFADREGVTPGAVYQWINRAKPAISEPIEVIAPQEVWGNHFNTPAITLEMDAFRCTIEPGFDRDTLAQVIEVIRQSSDQSQC